MNIVPLEWDTEFFGYAVARVMPGDDETLDEEALKQNHYRLIYVLGNRELTPRQQANLPLKLVDVKTVLGKPVTAPQHIHPQIAPVTQLTPKLLELVLQSGHYSRFKLDTQFVHQEYERLYEAWINNALADPDGIVYGYIENGILAGFITTGIKNNAADIGLIAVDETFRNKQIGQKLLAASEHFAQQKNLGRITVVTQEQNEGAMRFYLRNGFSVLQKTYIYHLWK